MTNLGTQTDFRTIGAEGPAYEVIAIKGQFVEIKILLTGEVVSNYPLKDYKNDPTAV